MREVSFVLLSKPGDQRGAKKTPDVGLSPPRFFVRFVCALLFFQPASVDVMIPPPPKDDNAGPLCTPFCLSPSACVGVVSDIQGTPVLCPLILCCVHAVTYAACGRNTEERWRARARAVGMYQGLAEPLPTPPWNISSFFFAQQLSFRKPGSV